MKKSLPAAWMEGLLRFLLPASDRDTITGDLREEFQDRAGADPQRARLWYLRQICSFAPARLRRLLAHRTALALLCTFTCLCGAWLGTMSVVLHHPATQILIAAGISSQAVVTLAALRLPRMFILRYLSMLGCLGMLWLCGNVVFFVARGAELEGYVLIISLALLFQSVLTFFTVTSPRGAAHSRG